MRIHLKEFLEESGIPPEEVYPGKRFVHACKQMGQFKSHCMVLDWRDPNKLRLEIKAGLSGRDLEPNKLKYYPVSFQTPTYVDVEIVNDNETEGEEGKGSKGKSGGGGKKPAKKSLKDMQSLASTAFGEAIKGAIPEVGKIVEMVILGTEIAKDAYGAVMGKLAQQIEHAKISTTDLLAQAGDFVTKYTPPAFMEPNGDEQAEYQYDREKNANIGYRPAM